MAAMSLLEYRQLMLQYIREHVEKIDINNPSEVLIGLKVISTWASSGVERASIDMHHGYSDDHRDSNGQSQYGYAER